MKILHQLPLVILLSIIYSGSLQANPKIDPIRFSLTTTATQVALNEEFELTVTAKYVSIPANGGFVFEGANAFRLKMVFPEGFRQTGGDFTNFTGTELSESKPSVTYKLKGKFTEASQGGVFQLLRSHRQASNESVYVEVGRLTFSLPGGGSGESQENQRIAVLGAAGYVPYLSISQLRAGMADTAKAVYITDARKFGLFRYDPLDTSTPDDGAMVLVHSAKRYKRNTDYVTPEMFGAVGDGVTDDHDAVQAALNSVIKHVVFKNATIYNLNAGLNLDITSRIVDGKGATLNFSNVTAGVAITVTGTMNPSFDASAFSSLNHLVIKGNSSAGSVTGLYLNETSSSGTVSNVSFSNLLIKSFGTGIKSGNKSYINTFNECNIYGNGVGIHIEGGTFDSGSSNRFINCSISGNVLAVRLNRDADTKFSNCVLGENNKHISLTDGRGYFEQCHLEGGDYTGPMVELLNGNGASISLSNCEIVTNSINTKPDYYFFIEPSNDHMRTIEVYNCFISFPGVPVNVALCGGAISDGSRFIISKTRGYWNNSLPIITYASNNLLANGSFEDSDLLSDDIFINKDGSILTSKLTGTNIKVSLHNLNGYTGSKSLKITKTSGIYTPSSVVIAVPCKPNTLYKGSYGFRQLGSASGEVIIGLGAGKVVSSADISVLKNGHMLYYGFYTPTSTWQIKTINDFAYRTSANDTYIYLSVDLSPLAAGDLLIDDVKIYEY